MTAFGVALVLVIRNTASCCVITATGGFQPAGIIDAGYNDLPSKHYIFLGPVMRLAAVRAIEFARFNFGFDPQIFPDCLPTRREFRR